MSIRRFLRTLISVAGLTLLWAVDWKIGAGVTLYELGQYVWERRKFNA